MPSVLPSATITDFLNRALASGSLAVGELEAKARAAGLLGERQQIQHAKPFKNAKKVLRIRSIRDGFGSGGKWAWLMPAQAAPEISSVANSDLATNVASRSCRTNRSLHRRVLPLFSSG